MKMNLFSWNFFWGVLLILWGLSLILRSFNIVWPLAKIFIAIMIIIFGIRLLLGNRSCIFSSKTHKHQSYSGIKVDSGGDYNIVFASGTIDLTNLRPDSRDLEINVIFGSAEVILPSNINFDIDATAVFGKNLVPKGINRNANAIRSIHIESNAVFGQIYYRIETVVTDIPDETDTPDDEVPNGEF